MRRREALIAMERAVFAGAVVAPLLLLLAECIFGRVRLFETFGGAFFAVTFFAVTSLAVALGTAVVASYVVKSLVLVGLLYFISFDSLDKNVVAASIIASTLCYLSVQTAYMARRRGRMRRRIAKGS